jgi:hypothetical protein
MLSRRDDLESLGYVFIYLATGNLPWRHLAEGDANGSFGAILATKLTMPIADLCGGLPEEFRMYMDEVRNLGFDEPPDYARYRGMFRNRFLAEGFSFDYRYDWLKTIRPQLSFTFGMMKPPGSLIGDEWRPAERAATGREKPPRIPLDRRASRSVGTVSIGEDRKCEIDLVEPVMGQRGPHLGTVPWRH